VEMIDHCLSFSSSCNSHYGYFYLLLHLLQHYIVLLLINSLRQWIRRPSSGNSVSIRMLTPAQVEKLLRCFIYVVALPFSKENIIVWQALAFRID
jgi:hypothetical protein